MYPNKSPIWVINKALREARGGNYKGRVKGIYKLQRIKLYLQNSKQDRHNWKTHDIHKRKSRIIRQQKWLGDIMTLEEIELFRQYAKIKERLGI